MECKMTKWRPWKVHFLFRFNRDNLMEYILVCTAQSSKNAELSVEKTYILFRNTGYMFQIN
jgi:hypothetical protein